jgi:hypothetical protein
MCTLMLLSTRSSIVYGTELLLNSCASCLRCVGVSVVCQPSQTAWLTLHQQQHHHHSADHSRCTAVAGAAGAAAGAADVVH